MASSSREDTWQAEKSEKTRQAIMDATVQCYIKYGYTNTTVTKIADEAGVSRGAMMHHFEDRRAVIKASVHYLADRRLKEFQSLVAPAKLDGGFEVTEEALDIAINALWKFFHIPSYVAFQELLIAARTDPELYKLIKSVQVDLDRETANSIHAMFPAWGNIESTRELVTDLLFYTLQGMAVSKIINKKQARVKNLLDLLVRETHAIYLRSVNESKKDLSAAS